MTELDVIDKAYNAAADCVVLVTGRGDVVGSGTWVAPNYVLTCAHVANGSQNERVTVTWQGRQLRAELIESRPAERCGSSLWSYPDLALLRVDEPPVDHPCILLSERHFSVDLRVVAIGYSTTYDVARDVADHLTFAGGTLAGFVGTDTDLFWQFRDNEIAPGMSGGPVIDQTTGALIGVVKSTREPDTDLGGLLVALRGLRHLARQRWQQLWRAHDAYHATDSPWPYLTTELLHRSAVEPPPITALEQAELYGLLTQMPEPTDLIATFVDAMPMHDVTDDEPLGLRDIAARLADRSSGGRPLHPLLEWVQALTENNQYGRIKADLARWSGGVARRRGEFGELRRRNKSSGSVSSDGQPPSIMIQIEPAAISGTHFGVTAWLYHGRNNVDQFHCDEEPNRTLMEAVECASDQIKLALRWLQGNAQIEFFTPIELINHPLEQLSLKDFSVLGVTNQVVVRSLERLQNPEIWHEWRKRWLNLRGDETGTAAEWVDCMDQTSAEARYARLLAEPEITVLGLSRRPQDPHTMKSAEVALWAGIPALIWRRDACREHDTAMTEQECTGKQFRAAVGELMVGQRATLPESVRQLRLKGVQKRDDPTGGIVLLWDDPERIPFEPTKFDQPDSLAAIEESAR